MGWSSAMNYIKAGAAKAGLVTKEPVRVDATLPFGARIGGILTLQLTPFIRANSGGSLVAIPDQSDELIVAISRLRMSLAGTLHRFYTAKGDQSAEAERFLQVYTDEQGAVTETMHCTRIVRFVPETVQDQNAYTGEGGAGLGDVAFTLWREQLAGMGVAADLLASAFGEHESIEYWRDAGGKAPFVAPFKGIETRVDDAQGENGLKQQIYYMPYVRNLPGGGQEFLIITTEIVEEQDGKGRREIHVDFSIGLPMEKERITIL